MQLGQIGAIVEFSFKQLHGYDREDKLEQQVDDQDVEDVLERVNDAVEYGLFVKEIKNILLGSRILIRKIPGLL